MEHLATLHLIVVGYFWWTLFFALGPMIWFYPLNELDITGYEAFAAIWLSPILLFIPSIRNQLSKPWSIRILELFMLAGLVSFQMKTTLVRLVVLALGNGAAMLYAGVTLFSGPANDRWERLCVLLSSLLVFLSSRILTTSLAPAWTSFQLNSICCTILISSIIVTIAANRKPTSSANIEELNTGKFPQFITGVALGSILYFTHWIFGDLHVLARWTVSGFPNTGPGPYYSAVFVLLALIAGFVISSTFPKAASSFYAWMIGSTSFLLFYYFDGWFGFVPGLLTAIFCTVCWTNLGRRLILCNNPGLILTTAMVFYLVEIFFHVWTVAYNFVPGGVYTREHSDWLICFICITVLPLFLGKRPSGEFRLPKVSTILFVLSLVITLLGTAVRFPRQPENRAQKVLHPDHRDFTALIWTFHFGYDNQGWPSLERAADVLNRTNADVIALLESDASKPYLGHNDLAMWLSEKLGMYVDFGPATKDHTWGNLLLSKYPIVSSKHHLLPSPYGELAPAISATINMSGNLVDIVSTHMGNDRDNLDRKVQTEYLSRITAASKNPVVLLAYVTSAPGSRDYVHYTTKGKLKDIDATDKHRWCEYIMYKNLIRLGYARVSHAGLSDTELQLGRFSIPKNLNNYEDNDLMKIDPSNVYEWQRFSSDFGSYTAGHFSGDRHSYHMDTPKYFIRKPKG